jgi:hypothetical protein
VGCRPARGAGEGHGGVGALAYTQLTRDGKMTTVNEAGLYRRTPSRVKRKHPCTPLKSVGGRLQKNCQRPISLE